MKLKYTVTGVILLLLIIIVSCQNEQQIEFDRYYSAGTVIFQTRCQNCHGAKGEGLQGLIPPLTDSVFLKTNKMALACAVKYGLKGKLTVLKRQFDGQMPANDLAPIQIAQALTYITNTFGNNLGIITSQQVENDLMKCK